MNSELKHSVSEDEGMPNFNYFNPQMRRGSTVNDAEINNYTDDERSIKPPKDFELLDVPE